MLVLLGDVLPHDEEDGGADQAVLDRAREEEGSGVREQLAHDVLLPVAEGDQVAEVEVSGASAGEGDGQYGVAAAAATAKVAQRGCRDVHAMVTNV